MLVSISAFASSKTDADAIYAKGNYKKAAAAYEAIIKNEGTSAEVYYNLGNCYYKLDEIPLAVLNYERALILSPGDADIRANLALARGKTADKVTPPSELFFITWWHDFTHIQSVDSWGTCGVIGAYLALICFLIYFLMSDVRVRKAGFYVGVAGVLLSILCNVAAYSQLSTDRSHAGAIVMAPAVSVKSSPSDNSTDLFIIHEGARLEILDSSMSNWYEVKFEEGKQGWVMANTLELI